MKKWLSLLITLALLLAGLPALSEGGSVSLNFEDETYKLRYQGAEIVDGKLNVAVGGFGNTMHMRNGKIVIPFWASVTLGGETLRAKSVSCDSSGVNTYSFESAQLPDAVYLSPYDDDKERTLLWESVASAGGEISAEPSPKQTAQPTPEQTAEPTPKPTPVPEPGGNEAEKFVDALFEDAAEASDDPWERAILLRGAWDTAWEDGEIRFFIRSGDPKLPELGDYADGKEDYLSRLFDNSLQNDIACALPATVEAGNFRAEDADVKAVLKAVKSAASKAKAAFDDKRVRVAVADYLLDADTISSDFGGAMEPAAYLPLSAAQGKQSLDVSGGPSALKLKCSGANGAKLVEKAYAAALERLSKKAYANAMERSAIEELFREELNAQAVAFKKSGAESFVFAFSISDLLNYRDPGEEFASYLGDYESAYSEKLDELIDRTYEMPDMPALDFPKSGRISGKSSGTLINFRIPDDGMARYVQMRRADTGEAVVAAFIRPGGKASVRVPKGDYYIMVGAGDTWYGPENLFGENAQYSRTEELEIMSSSYYHNITLGGATDGNMSSYGADLSDFQ